MARNPAAVEAIAKACGLKTWPSFVERACCDKKEVFLNGGWRGGKSNTAAFLVFTDILTQWLHVPLPVDSRGQTIGSHLIWIVGPEFEQAREEYNYLTQWAQRLGWHVEASSAVQGPLRATFSFPGLPGVITLATKSANDPMSLGSVAPVIILAAECGQFSEEAKKWLEGRAIEKNAKIIWSGTFHNEEGKAQFEWYERVSAEVRDNPTPRREAFRLPSWENEYLFGNCLEGQNSILNDPTLKIWCPDENHGPAHSGMDHPIIRIRHDEFKDSPKEWDKRFGGIPTGLPGAIYEWARESPNFFLRPMPAELKTPTFGKSPIWITTAGGIDPGLVHPAALTVGSIVASGPHQGETWVRSGVFDQGNTAKSMWAAKDFLEKKFGRMPWGGDPNGLQYTREYENIEAMRGSLYAREARVKVVNGVAQDRMLFFDSDDPYVVLLFAQIQRVHRRKDANGQLVYDRRADDDMVASFEDMMAMLHGQPVIPKGAHRQPIRRRTFSRQPVVARSAS